MAPRTKKAETLLDRDRPLARRWRYAWAEESVALLGTMSDPRLARKLGVSPQTVLSERKRRGIASFRARGPRVEWTQERIDLLGTDTDRNVAEILGIGRASVALKRAQLGIPASCAPRGGGVRFQWSPTSEALLGKMPDRAAAEHLGLSLTTVWVRRRALGIAPFKPSHDVEWSPEKIELLGRVADAELARRWGTVEATVQRKREELGRAPLRFRSGPTEIRGARAQELLDRLGKVPDVEIAEDLGLTRGAVGKLRRRLGISAYHPVEHWSASEIELLGTLPDLKVADRIGRSRKAVTQKRRKLRIAVFSPVANPETPGD